jgi:hypothetical protein
MTGALRALLLDSRLLKEGGGGFSDPLISFGLYPPYQSHPTRSLFLWRAQTRHYGLCFKCAEAIREAPRCRKCHLSRIHACRFCCIQRRRWFQKRSVVYCLVWKHLQQTINRIIIITRTGLHPSKMHAFLNAFLLHI